jgi:predicted nucleotidyltransferase
LDRRRFWERSDIDLAIEGITDPAAFFALYGEADRLTSFPLDLVALERVEPEFAEMIRSTGRVVYEQRG